MEKLQIVVAAMWQKNFSKIEELNISSDTFFANQLNIIVGDNLSNKIDTFTFCLSWNMEAKVA